MPRLWPWVVSVLSLGFSAMGIVVAVKSPCKCDMAQRGGAVGSALALVFLLLSRGYGASLYRLLHEGLPETRRLLQRLKGVPEQEEKLSVEELTKKLEALTGKLDNLANSIAKDAKEQRVQNFFVALTTIVGTLTWGFGDWFAELFKAHRCIL